jgi:hypothetical protein
MDARYLDALPTVPLGACRGRPDAATVQAIALELTRLGQRLEQAWVGHVRLSGMQARSLPEAAPDAVLAVWKEWIGSPLPDTTQGEGTPLAIDVREALQFELPDSCRICVYISRRVSGHEATFAALVTAEALMPVVVAGRRRVRRGLITMLVGLGLLFTGLIPFALLTVMIGGAWMIAGYAKLGGPFTHQVWQHDPVLAEALITALREGLGPAAEAARPLAS